MVDEDALINSGERQAFSPSIDVDRDLDEPVVPGFRASRMHQKRGRQDRTLKKNRTDK